MCIFNDVQCSVTMPRMMWVGGGGGEGGTDNKETKHNLFFIFKGSVFKCVPHSF